MKVHIIQANESLKDIAKKYDIQVDDIIKNNMHISNIYNILPGMKLKLPILAEEAQEKFRDNTIDIKEYYPTIDDFKKYYEQENPEEEDNPEFDVVDDDEQEITNQYVDEMNDDENQNQNVFNQSSPQLPNSQPSYTMSGYPNYQAPNYNYYPNYYNQPVNPYYNFNPQPAYYPNPIPQERSQNDDRQSQPVKPIKIDLRKKSR